MEEVAVRAAQELLVEVDVDGLLIIGDL